MRTRVKKRKTTTSARRARRTPRRTRAPTMKIPTYDVKPGSKAYSGLGERLMSAMGWSRCVARARSSSFGRRRLRPVDGARPNDDDDDDDGDGDERRGARARDV